MRLDAPAAQDVCRRLYRRFRPVVIYTSSEETEAPLSAIEIPVTLACR